MDISLNIVLFVAVVAAAACVIYGVRSTTRLSSRAAEIRHEEFEDSREAEHRESMAKIAATRDAEIAKYTHQAPKPAPAQIEG